MDGITDSNISLRKFQETMKDRTEESGVLQFMGHKELVGHDLENEQQKSFDLAQVCMKNIFPPKWRDVMCFLKNIYLFIGLPQVLVVASRIFSCSVWDLVPCCCCY